MIEISRAQMRALQQSAEIDYEVRLVRFLREQFPDAAQEPESSIRDGVRGQVACARKYGLVTEVDIGIYVSSAWLLGADFDREFPAAREMLLSDAPAEVKADWLAEFAVELFDRLAPPP